MARQAHPSLPFSWRSDRCYQALRQVLLEMSQGHCAFCDGFLGPQSIETVEHFRPKSGFPALAYDWDNLFPCCGRCQAAKREAFDELLLKPDVDGYAFSNFFIMNFHSGELEPLPGATEDNRRRAEVTIALYGLNSPTRNRERLREWRHHQRDPAPCLDDYPYRFVLE